MSEPASASPKPNRLGLFLKDFLASTRKALEIKPTIADVVCPVTYAKGIAYFHVLGHVIPERRIKALLSRRYADVKGCHICTLAPSSPYAHLCLYENGHAVNVSAHRLAHALFIREMRDELLACHTCNVKRCINPAHLYEGTYQDNAADLIATGVLVGGDVPHFMHLLPMMVELTEIGWTQKQIADEIGVTQKTVSNYLRKYS